MALAYLLDPTKQYQNMAGVNNVAGWLEVFISDTPERADVYVDFAGTRAPERIGIDNNGRAVMVVDGEGVYRVEMHAPNGDLLWTQYPIWPVGQGGGGAIGVDIGSSDGSIDVQRTQVGSVVNYDLSVAADGTDLLGWGEYIGYTMDGTHMVPSYSAGTIVTGPHGIRLQGGQYYHVTVTLGASSLEQNVYDAFRVSFRGVDGDGAVNTFTTKSFHYDASTGEGHSYDVSFDMMPATDVEMYAEATGLESGISVGIAEVYVHRVYSGAPFVPGTVADKDWVEDNFQENLVAGQNIIIEGNVISATGTFLQQQADWAQSDSSAVDYIKNKPVNLVQDANYVHTDNNFTTAEKNKLSGIAAGAEVNVQADWNETDTSSDAYIANKPANLVQDAGYVHTDNNFTNADVTKLSGIAAGAEVNVHADWTESDSSSDAFILHKPAIPTKTSDLTNDSGFITLSDIPAQVNADWNSSSGASEILNKPSIPSKTSDLTNDSGFITSADAPVKDVQVNSSSVVDAQGVANINLSGFATTQDLTDGLADKQDVLTAGSNITITNNVISATASPQQQADWDQTNSSAVDYIKNKPVNLVQDANYVHTDNNFTNADATKLSGIATGAEVNVQANWNETNTSSDAYIQNKPTIPVLPDLKELTAGANITITESQNAITISASVPVIGTVTV